MKTPDNSEPVFLDFPKIDQPRVGRVKAAALTAEHALVMKGNDGSLYAVPLFDLEFNAESGVVNFRCQWGGGEIRSALSNDYIEVVI